MTYILSFIVAFGVTAIAGQILIPILRRLKAGQSIREDGPTWHMSKQGTPTMGGLMFILGIGIAVLTAGWGDLQRGLHNHLVVFLFALVFGAIGFVDDFQKLRHHANEGLTAPQKFFLQLAAAVVFVILMRRDGYLTPDLYIPFLNVEIVGIPWIVYMVFAAFVMVGTVNAVNLTDGVDGLATGVTIPVMICYVAVSAWYGRTDLVIVSAALAGGLSAFLIYNFHPAKVFMGDTGSLFLGGRGVRPGLRSGPAFDDPHCGTHLRPGGSVRYYPGGILQEDRRQAVLPHGAPPPPSGDGWLERDQAVLRLFRDYPGAVPAGVPGSHESVSHVIGKPLQEGNFAALAAKFPGQKQY